MQNENSPCELVLAWLVLPAGNWIVCHMYVCVYVCLYMQRI
jgi:hypothetical protein